MKRNFYYLVMLMVVCMEACAGNEQLITFEQLPEPAKAIVNQSFADNQLLHVFLEKEFPSDEYEVHFADGIMLEFDKDGALLSVSCRRQAVPDELLPEPVRNYVLSNFNGSIVKEWKRDGRYWKAELDNELELIFDRNYKFIRFDD